MTSTAAARVDGVAPFKRELVDRCYRVIALGMAIESLAEGLGEKMDANRAMAIRHLGRAANEEASACVDEIELAALSERRRP